MINSYYSHLQQEVTFRLLHTGIVKLSFKKSLRFKLGHLNSTECNDVVISLATIGNLNTFNKMQFQQFFG